MKFLSKKLRRLPAVLLLAWGLHRLAAEPRDGRGDRKARFAREREAAHDAPLPVV